MPVPSYRVPVKIARGTYANLSASLASLEEGEIVYANDENALYVVEGGVLTKSSADLGISSIDDLGDVDTSTTAPTDGQALVWNNSASQWEPGGVSGEIEWTLTENASTDYIFAGAGFAGTETDPTIYVVRGQTYKFTNTMGAHPFQIQSTQGLGGTAYNDGVTNNAVSNGTLVWEVRMDAPSELYYQCTSHADMNGTIHVLDEGSSIASINDLGDVTITSPADNQILAYNAANSAWENITGLSGSATLIVPFGQGYIDDVSAGSGPGLTWGAWNAGSGNIAVTFNAAQPNADYSVITDNESADDVYVSVASKTTVGFTLSTYDLNGNPTSPATYPFSFQVWASDPTITVGGTGAAVLDDLADVDTTTAAPTDGQVLAWDNAASQWAPADGSIVGVIDDLTDVDTTTTAPTDGQVLTWVNANSRWEPADGSVVGVIDDLTDVDTTTVAPTAGQVLVWNNTASLWEPGTIVSSGPGAGLYLSETQTAASGTADFTSLGYSGILQKVTSDLDAWIVLYSSSAERTADSSRAYNTDPTPGSGVLFEAYVTAGGTVVATPGTTYMNNDTTLTEAVYAAVRDQAGAAVNASVTFSAYGLAAITTVSGGTFGSG